jgi:multidrug efflux system outer membrane protein
MEFISREKGDTVFCKLTSKITSTPLLVTILSVAGLSGCIKVGPDFKTPDINIEGEFSRFGSVGPATPDNLAWWMELNDKKLDDLILRGAADNLDIKEVTARIQEAEALIRSTGLNAQIEGPLSVSSSRDQTESLPVQTSDARSVSTSYVFDLFGGYARDRERAVAIFQARNFDVGVTRLLFLSEIITSYIELRYWERILKLSNDINNNNTEILRIVRLRSQSGLSTEFEEQQAIARLARSNADIPVLKAQYEIEIFRLATLLNEPSSRIFTELSYQGVQLEPRSPPVSGFPIELLRNRPDVRAAERILAAETAAIGVATAALYPSLRIFAKQNYSELEVWNAAASLSAPILERGRLLSLRDAQIAKALQAEINWRKTVMDAVEDVQVAMREAEAWRQQITSLRTATAATIKLRKLSTEQYVSGLISLNELLDANTQLAESLLKEANAIREYALSWTRVQIATGRGWQGSLLGPAESKVAGSP